MRIITPAEVATETGNKYLGVLVAAKFARFVNDFPRDRSVDFEQKLTTRALDELVRARLPFRLVRRRRQEDSCRSPARTVSSPCPAGVPPPRLPAAPPHQPERD